MKIVLSTLFLFLAVYTYAQEITFKSTRDSNGFIRCHTMEADSIRRAEDPKLGSFFESTIDNILNSGAPIYSTKATLITIPVVVHVIHNGDALGASENINNEQVLSQIRVLNEDFRRMLGTPGYNSSSVGADIEIEFCMAQIDPNGNSTNGINRVNYGSASFTSNAAVETMKANTIWDPTKYLNMWSVRFSGGMAGTLGYAQFPSNSGLGGMPANGGNANTDGVVSSFDAFGSQAYAPGAYNATYNLGRTMTHEIGHWFGLRHIWGDGGCTVDDFCNDTPGSDGANFGCPNTNSCTDPSPNPRDMVENYMDYTDDACMNVFTADQKARIRTVMTLSPRRMELASSTVCAVVLPVELSLFSGEVKERYNTLFWETSSEYNCSHFIVTKSSNGILFNQFDEINCTGNSTELIKYSIDDYNPFEDETYYRLSQVDVDGTTTNSKTIVLARANNDELIVAPNPAMDQLKLTLNQSTLASTLIEIYSSNGQLVLSENYFNTNVIDLNISELRKGIYTLRVINDSIKTRKIVKL